ncbi:hypothetical protein OG352_05970 [Streptomyces sp. NBC_01485]|uniref:hypothetical protein n=1 Tax=Streptomyces sp. NBC_01485 TaxID=2903884 RepID=UPI002E365BB6|nr:hypothetical protein [Streptomyces sp. NBC_01485]
MHTTTASEWAQMTSLAVALYASVSVPYFLLVDADLKDFDPRPAVRCVLVSAAADWLLATTPGTRLVVAVSNAPTAARDFYRDAAALALLLTTSPKGAMA